MPDVSPHRRVDVLERVDATIFELNVVKAAETVERDRRNTYTSDGSDRFESRSDVNAIAIEVVTDHHDVAEVDSDPQRNDPAEFCDGRLNLDSAPDRGDNRAEFDEQEDEFIERLRRQKEQVAVQAFINDLKQRTEITYNQEILATIMR